MRTSTDDTRVLKILLEYNSGDRTLRYTVRNLTCSALRLRAIVSDDFVIEKPNGVAATPVVDSALGCSCERWSLEPEVPASGIVDVASEYNFPESGTYEARIRYNSRRQTAKDECYEDCDRAAAESNTVTIEITGDQVFDDDVRRFVNESKYRSFIGRIRQKRWWPFG